MGGITLYQGTRTRSTGAMVMVEELGAEVDDVLIDMKAAEQPEPAFVQAAKRASAG